MVAKKYNNDNDKAHSKYGLATIIPQCLFNNNVYTNINSKVNDIIMIWIMIRIIRTLIL